MIITKTSTGFAFIISGGMYGFSTYLLAWLEGIDDLPPPPSNISFIQWVDYYSAGLGVLASIGMVVTGAIFFIFKHLETKRHNKAMEPKDDP